MQFIKRIAVVLLISLLLAFSCVTVGAETTSTNKDYYLIDYYPYTQEIAKTFEVVSAKGNFEGYGMLATPQDFCIDSNGIIYILDSGNSRILVLDKNLEVTKEIRSEFNEPCGICVSDGSIFVADTGNSRIVKLDMEGNVQKIFTQPDDEAYDSEYEFRPTKIEVDSNGKIYLLNKLDYHGLIVLESDGEFTGYIGTTKIKNGFKERFLRIFATKEQREQIARSTPAYLTGFDITKENLIYAVSNWESKNQLKLLTPSGNNILPSKFYGEDNENINYGNLPAFYDVAVDNNGIAYACDIAQSKIYVYDKEGNNLSVFGSMGIRNGCFSSVCAVEVDGSGKLYALDSTTGVIQIFSPTELMKSIITATTLYNDGQYEEAVTVWNKVAETDVTHYLANNGIAKAQQRVGNYSEAMQLYKNAENKSGYSEVFSEMRLKTVRKYFVWVVLAVAVIVVLLLFLFKRLSKKAKQIDNDYSIDPESHGLKFYLYQSILAVFHPIDAFDRLRRNRNSLKPYAAVVMFLALVLSRLLFVLFLHFPFLTGNFSTMDLLQQLTMFIIPLVCFAFINYLITTVMGGEQTLIEAVYATLYSFTPYIFLAFPISVLSNILSSNESGLFYFIYYGILLWCVALLLCSVYRMNGFSFGKFVSVIAVTVFAMVCFIIVLFLIGLVFYQLIRFISELAVEIAFISAGV